MAFDACRRCSSMPIGYSKMNTATESSEVKSREVKNFTSLYFS